MPYIKTDLRSRIDIHLNDLIYNLKYLDWGIKEGCVNYTISRILNALAKEEMSYARLNSLIGAIEAAKLEFYRRTAVPYENSKIAENGDI